MRALIFIVLAGAVGWWVADRLAEPRAPEYHAVEPPAPKVDPAEEARAAATARLRTGTVTLRVVTPDRSVPLDTRVGYVFRGEERLFRVNDGGWRRLTDVPLYELEFVARAPGYEESRQTRTPLAGIPEEVVLNLRPTRSGGGTDR